MGVQFRPSTRSHVPDGASNISPRLELQPSASYSPGVSAHPTAVQQAEQRAASEARAC